MKLVKVPLEHSKFTGGLSLRQIPYPMQSKRNPPKASAPLLKIIGVAVKSFENSNTCLRNSYWIFRLNIRLEKKA